MVEGFSMTVVKYLMFVFNFVFVLCGLTLIILGTLVTKKEMTEFLDNKYVTAPAMLMFIGCVTFVVAFFGLFGAVRENSCMVMTFGILLFVIVVFEIAGGVTAYIYKEQVGTFLKQGMKTSLTQHKNDSMKLWEKMQTTLECCGVDNAADYTKLKLKIPPSCCKSKNANCTESEAYKIGCYPQMLVKIHHHIAIVIGVAIGFALIELLGCIFAWCLVNAIKDEEET